MGFGSDGKRLFRLLADAIQANTELGSDESGLRATESAGLVIHRVAFSELVMESV